MNKYIVLDTETTNTIEEPICYDIGFAVIDEEGTVYETHSYVIAEIFLDKALMAEAYFSDKIPQYWEDIKSGKRKLCRMKTVKMILQKICKEQNIQAIIAHNARFDYSSTTKTQRYITCSKYRYFLPYGVPIWDTLKMSRAVLGKDENYAKFCHDNEYITKNGQLRFTAEIIYRFLTKNNDFVESHTGLEDVLIEKVIFVYCIQTDPTVERLLWSN